ncbi:MAG TPA: tetratricopeptide repeat protein [Opitutaceae bacterium]|nr:tetratricopeptide repeat protein [Opitutaceae bacterium]
MTRRRTSVPRALLAALLVALLEAGCVAPATKAPSAKAPAVAEAAEAFRNTMRDARAEGRREVEDILGVYANLPAEQAPGVAALRRDIVEALATLKRENRERLTVGEVDRLTVRNPHFWTAWFEFDARDSSLLMLHASLLMEAGEFFRASMVLTVGVQTLPLNVQERFFWFTQQARTHFTAFRRLDELAAAEKAWGQSRRAREKGLARMVVAWPADGFALEALLQSRAGFKPGSMPEDDRVPIALLPQVRARVLNELEQLRRANPVAAVRYTEDQAAAAEFGRLWARVSDEDRAIEQRELAQFAAVAKKLGLGELAMIAGRAVAARRGLAFMAPADLEFVRECLPLVLPATEAAPILARIEEGRMPGFQLTRPQEQPGEILAGMDPAIHPLLADHAVREFARESLWIEAADGNLALRAQHLRLRAIVSSNAGRYEAALEDLDAALKLKPSMMPWQIDRAGILSKMGRLADADTVFAQVAKSAPEDEYLRTTLGVHHFGQGRFAEAEQLFRAVKADDDNLPYDVIFGYLAGLRRGAPDRAWLEQNRLKSEAWPAAIHRHLLGEIDRAVLLASARDSSDLRTTEQQCEAYFTLGELALATGDTAAATREFENCVQSGIVGFIEYDLARRELARLRPPAAVEQPAAKPAPAEPSAPEKNSDRPAQSLDEDDGSPV